MAIFQAVPPLWFFLMMISLAGKFMDLTLKISPDEQVYFIFL